MCAIYTKTGDKGETALFGGSRVTKNDLRVECYGTLDEVNAVLGVARSFITDEAINNTILCIQKNLFIVSAEIASDEIGKQNLSQKLSQQDIKKMEQTIDQYTENLNQLTHFIIPGDTKASAFLHLSRTVVRRAERKLVDLKEVEEVKDEICQYINRLSDLLFTLARVESE